MTTIVKAESCGNSPKYRVLLELTIAFARADKPRLLRLLTTGATWQPAGKTLVTGAEAVIRAMTRHGAASALEINHVVAHGKAGTVDGVIQFGGKRIAFCFVYEFSSAKGTAVSNFTSFTQALPARG